ncbi:MAG: NAD(P)/FAD-dependent oxidoreductase [Halobacteriales archaeon]
MSSDGVPGRPTLPTAADIVIIGGGIMGTSTAFFLATETDLDVTLLEKDTIASGSTGDSSAILRHHYGPQKRYSRMAWWSHEFYRAFEDRTGQRIARNENPLVRFAETGTGAAEYAQAGYEVLSELDIPASRIEAPTFPPEYDMLDLEDYDFAISDDTAAYSDGSDAANGFARAAAKAGATVVTGTAVTDIHVTGGAVTGVETDDGTVDCEAVVAAAGPWTPRVAEMVGIEVPITTSREQIIILDPPEEYANKYENLTPTTAVPGGEWYMRPDFGGGILIATHHTGEEVDPDNYEQEPDESMLVEFTERIGEAMPELREATVKGQYCGVYSTTPDHDFIIDQVGPEGCYLACGFSGHGFKHGPAVGRILTDLIRHGDTDLVDVEYFSLSRFDDHPDGHGKPGDLA